MEKSLFKAVRPESPAGWRWKEEESEERDEDEKKRKVKREEEWRWNCKNEEDGEIFI